MKSTIALSMHKAGSSIADLILVDFFTEKGMVVERIAKQVPESPKSEAEFFIGYQKGMHAEGYYYGIARGPYVSEMPIIWDLRAIIQVRDPRDCLTSAYFSFRESHTQPKDPSKRKAFMERREALRMQTIDQYVLREVRGYEKRLAVLRTIAESHDDVMLLKYEEMVNATEQWLDRISKFLDQPLTDTLMRAIGDKLEFTVAREDVKKHKRQVTPGDHRRKLKPETIDEISSVLEEQLSYFGYAK